MHLLLANNSASGGGAAGAFESIASATGTGSSDTITFSNIPSTYQHLQVRWIARDTGTNASAAPIYIRFNGISTATYASHRLLGNGASASVGSQSSQTSIRTSVGMAYGANASNIMGVGILNIHDYASTTKATTIRVIDGADFNNDNGKICLESGLWTGTSAITSITFTLFADANFATTTQFALYGIKAAA